MWFLLGDHKKTKQVGPYMEIFHYLDLNDIEPTKVNLMQPCYKLLSKTNILSQKM